MRRTLLLLCCCGSSVAQTSAAIALPDSPRVLWHEPSAPFSTYGRPACQRGLVYIGGGHLRALDLRTGAVVHRGADEGLWHNPVLGGGLVFARHDDGSVHALTAKLDRTLWRVPLERGRFAGVVCGDVFAVVSGSDLVAIAAGELQWRVGLGGHVASSPVSDGRRVFCPTADGHVLAVDVGTGETLWRCDVAGDVSHGNAALADDRVFVADRGRPASKLTCIDVVKGRIEWQSECSDHGSSTPWIAEAAVWLGSREAVLCFDRRTGALDPSRTIATPREPIGTPAIVGDALAFGCLAGSFRVHDERSREPRWSFAVRRGHQVGAWSLHDSVLLVSTSVGLFAIGDDPTASPAPTGFVLEANDR